MKEIGRLEVTDGALLAIEEFVGIIVFVVVVVEHVVIGSIYLEAVVFVVVIVYIVVEAVGVVVESAVEEVHCRFELEGETVTICFAASRN